MVCAGDITGEQQCLRTAGAVPNVFCDSRMCQPCLVALGGRPSAPIPPSATPWQHWLLGWGWLSRPGQSILEEIREERSRSSTFPLLEEELGEQEELGLGPCWTGASCPIVISLPCSQTQWSSTCCDSKHSHYWPPGAFGRGEEKVFA